jgi:transglutaminase-like putative cysteine protease
MPQFKIKHLTKYIYKGTVRDSANQVILFPIHDDYQQVLKHDLKNTADPIVDVYKDYYGNEVGNFTYSGPHHKMEIFSRILVNTRPRPLPLDDMFASQQWLDLKALHGKFPYIDYLKQESFDGNEALKDALESDKIAEETPYQTALRCNKYVYDNFRYIPGITTVESTLDEVWKLKAGVCQDFAHILLVMLRLVSIPSRYVSGYICPHRNGMRGEGATHAWVEAYLPHYGWIGLDPTNNCVANETHVRLAVGRNFTDCSPVKGVYKGAPEHKLEVLVSVAYEDDQPEAADNEIIIQPVVAEASYINSFRMHMERIQQQQQQ